MKISIILLLIYFLLACGGSSTNNKMTAENKSPAPPAKTEQKTIPEKKPAPRPAAEKFPVISEVKFKSPARSRTDLELEASLAEPDFDVAFDFRWFVNDKEVIGVKEPVLPAHHFKSGDWVHCRVTATKEDRKSRPVKSKYILIRGSAPVLELEPIPEFSVPGTFQYQIKAIDPDVLPGEEPALSFELVSPRDLGITLDPQTGQMKWELSEETIKKLKEKIEIKFKVIKKGAPEVQSSITLTFSDTGEEGQQTGETE